MIRHKIIEEDEGRVSEIIYDRNIKYHKLRYSSNRTKHCSLSTKDIDAIKIQKLRTRKEVPKCLRKLFQN